MSQFVEWFAGALTDAGWPRVFATLISSDERRLTETLTFFAFLQV
jgi:hypothetical protein